MRKFKFQLDRKSLEIIYTVFIRPILEYCNEIWDNCTQYEKDDLEKIRLKRLELLQELLSWFQLKIFTAKLDGKN